MGVVRLPQPAPQYDPREQAILRSEIEMAILRLDAKLEDVRVAPRVRDIAISFNEVGQALVNIRCNDDTLSLRYAVSADGAPSQDTVQASGVQDGPDLDVTLEGPFSVGAVLYISVLPYAGPDGDGREGALKSNSATRGDPFYEECRAIVLASSDTTITIEASGVSTTGIATVELEDADGLTILSGLAEGVAGTSPQRWTFQRPVGTDGQPRFTAHFPDAVDDSDIALVPALGFSPLYFLGCRARVLEDRDAEMLVRVATADPFPQGANSARLTATLSGVASTTPALPVDLTPTAVYSAADDAYVDLTIPKPGFGAADGEVVFRLQSLVGTRVDDYDVLAVPAQTRATPWVRASRTVTALQATITWDGGPTVELSTDGGVTWAAPPASPFTVDRPPSVLEADLQYLFRGVGFDNGQTIYATQTVTIPRQGPTYVQAVMVTLIDAPGDGGGSFSVDWNQTVSDPSSLTYEVIYSITDGGAGTDFVTDQVATATAKPVVVSTPLGDDGGLSPIGGVVVVRAYYEDTLLEEDDYDGLFAI